MTTVYRMEFLELSTYQTNSGPTSMTRLYLVGAMSTGTTTNGTENKAIIAVGDPTQITNTQSTFSAIPISTSWPQGIDLEGRFPTMSNIGLTVEETDIVYVSYQVRAEGLASQWKPYETVSETISDAAGTVLSSGSGSTATTIGKVAPAIDKALDAIINITFPDRNADPPCVITQPLADMRPINSFRISQCSDGATTIYVHFRMSRDDHDWRWDTQNVVLTPPAIAPGQTGQVQVTLHNVGRQTFAPETTSLIPVMPQSSSPDEWTEDPNSEWLPASENVTVADPAAPGEDLLFNFPVTVPPSAVPGTKLLFEVMPRINDRDVGLIPGESPRGSPLTITVPVASRGELAFSKVRATGPTAGGSWWKFSATDPISGQPIPDNQVTVLLNGKPGGTAASPYRVTSKFVGKFPDRDFVVTPDIVLVAPGYTPTETGV